MHKARSKQLYVESSRTISEEMTLAPSVKTQAEVPVRQEREDISVEKASRSDGGVEYGILGEPHLFQ